MHQMRLDEGTSRSWAGFFNGVRLAMPAGWSGDLQIQLHFSVGRWNCTEEHLESLGANMGIASKRILHILDQNEVDRDQSCDRHHHPDMHSPALQPEEKAKRNHYDSPNDQRHPDGLWYLLGHRIQPVPPRCGQAVYAHYCLLIEDLLLAGAG